MAGDPFESLSLKNDCSSCPRHVACMRLQKILSALALEENTEAYPEYRVRFQSLKQELLRLGYAYPSGNERCQLKHRDSRANIALLHEAQELLIEIKDFSCMGQNLRRSN